MQNIETLKNKIIEYIVKFSPNEQLVVDKLIEKYQIDIDELADYIVNKFSEDFKPRYLLEYLYRYMLEKYSPVIEYLAEKYLGIEDFVLDEVIYLFTNGWEILYDIGDEEKYNEFIEKAVNNEEFLKALEEEIEENPEIRFLLYRAFPEIYKKLYPEIEV